MKILIVLLAFYGFYGSNLAGEKFINYEAVQEIVNQKGGK